MTEAAGLTQLPATRLALIDLILFQFGVVCTEILDRIDLPFLHESTCYVDSWRGGRRNGEWVMTRKRFCIGESISNGPKSLEVAWYTSPSPAIQMPLNQWLAKTGPFQFDDSCQ